METNDLGFVAAFCSSWSRDLSDRALSRPTAGAKADLNMQPDQKSGVGAYTLM